MDYWVKNIFIRFTKSVSSICMHNRIFHTKYHAIVLKLVYISG